MKRLALVAAVLTVAACTTKDTKTDAADTTASMAPAPAATDTAMKADSTMKMDSTMKADTTKKADSTKH